ncbi:MAG: TIGR04255 family protein [Planctomycetes bacterium]|nr:TIGR04255 family protein [Planctomycetota bacterium]MBI3834563.1 TIGR04255 family protein [Planctomycetota bacterium]
MTVETLPTFKSPPVIETVLGVQFDPIPDFTNAHLGAFWKWLRTYSPAASERWIKPVDAPTIEPSFERFENDRSWFPFELMMKVASNPPLRLQARKESGDAMIQIQNTRLHYNWIGTVVEPVKYPRYSNVRPAFDRMYEAFCDFLKEEGLSSPKENQWEVTYVNEIPIGTVWNAPEDCARLFPSLLGSGENLRGLTLEGLAASWRFEIPVRMGRLHADLRHTKATGSEPKEALRLTLTARGAIGSKGEGEETLTNGLDLGRTTIVRTFTNMTSEDAHKAWGREQ